MKQKQSSGAIIAAVAALMIILFLLGGAALGFVAFWRMNALEAARRAESQQMLMELRARDAQLQAEMEARLADENALRQGEEPSLTISESPTN